MELRLHHRRPPRASTSGYLPTSRIKILSATTHFTLLCSFGCFEYHLLLFQIAVGLSPPASLLYTIGFILSGTEIDYTGSHALSASMDTPTPNLAPSHPTPLQSSASNGGGPKKRRRIHLNCEECRRTKSRCKTFMRGHV